jgi:hypothetical protein
MRARHLLPLVLLTVAASSMAAQEPDRTTVTFAVSPSFIQFDGFGGSFGTAVAQLRVQRTFGVDAGGELSMFAVVPMGAATSIPSCPLLGSCVTRSTPNVLNGVIASGYRYLGATGLRIGLGGGNVWASGGEGSPHTSSLAGLAGIDWESRSSGIRPTIGVRMVLLTRPIYGARQLLVPGAGFSF